MSTKSRHVVWGSKIMGAEMRAETARKAAKEAVRKADRAEAEAWSIRMQGYGGPARPPAECRAALLVQVLRERDRCRLLLALIAEGTSYE
jgi:hypothetical protein